MRAGDYKTIQQAEHFDKLRFSGGLVRVHKDEMEVIKKWLSKIKPQGKTAIDLGTGPGRIAKQILDTGCKKLYALDQSRAMLKYQSDIFKREIKNGTFEQVNAPSDKIPLKDRSVEITTAFHLLKHIVNTEGTFAEVERVLKTGGYFAFDVLNINSVIRFNLGTCFALSEKEVNQLAARNGFEIVNVIYLHAFGETIYRVFGKILSVIPAMLDHLINSLGLNVGTKILVLSRKK